MPDPLRMAISRWLDAAKRSDTSGDQFKSRSSLNSLNSRHRKSAVAGSEEKRNYAESNETAVCKFKADIYSNRSDASWKRTFESFLGEQFFTIHACYGKYTIHPAPVLLPVKFLIINNIRHGRRKHKGNIIYSRIGYIWILILRRLGNFRFPRLLKGITAKKNY